ncbi:hypothetical protein PENARI_c005G00862 [Penicillium arizonense]|uniref:Enoyl reductase (ER) domain-containing protein n=1 Tax=Penicillium arizonense TaxID=1835702 RepID=A0A1F5LPB6_PENAI|nr:hypothetical protein PENARI_c005G00862 [Penicillium arizonense]OGE55062.1 hypothetical protein PENARI_c005G00862 [Penicillium arizonense]
MAPETMKAALCKEEGDNLSIGGAIIVEDVDVPKPGSREVLIKLAAASLCSTDLSVMDGMFGPKCLPVILGHEAVGVVAELGPESESYGLKVGQLVGAPPYTGMCLECHNCKKFGPDHCSAKKVKGINAPGYFSEYSLIDAASAVIVADDATRVDDVGRISPIFCAGVTVWDALERAQIEPGQSLAILGLGGLGQLCARYATALGAKVFALDIQDAQLNEVRNTVHEVINMKDLSPAEVDAKMKQVNNERGAEVAIVTAGSSMAYQMALSILEPLGRIVVVGLPKEPLSISAGQMSANCTK